MKIFNTLTREKEEFRPIKEGEAKIYACGPTVYNFIHIGNARPICVFDVLRRYLEYRGYNVTFVQNFTDIDDKIIKRANEEGLSFKEISEKYIEEFWTDAKGLNFRPATIHPKATENIDQIIEIVSGLIENGHAYEVDGDVYFSPEAIKTIVETETDDIEFFASAPPFSKDYPKKWEEPFALKVANTEHLKSAVKWTIENADRFYRKPIMWELWQVIKGTPLNVILHNYTAVNDYTCDIDQLEDIGKSAL